MMEISRIKIAFDFDIAASSCTAQSLLFQSDVTS